MNWFEVYIWTRLDALHSMACALFAVAATTLVFAVVYCFWALIVDEEYIPFSRKAMRYAIVATTVTGFFMIAIPDKQEAAMVYAIPKIVDSDIPDDFKEIYDLGIDGLKNALKNPRVM